MNDEQQLLRRLSARFAKACATYRLLADGDRVLIGLSGGKDSLLLAQLMGRRARIHRPSFSVEALHVRMENVGYAASTDYLHQFCAELSIPLHVATASFREPAGKPPCFLCSWQRRKMLFNMAQELGCNKIALGHHRDDILHTTLMNLIFQGRFATMPARLRLRKMPIEIVRPLCLIDEADISRYASLAAYQPIRKTCPHERDTTRNDAAHLWAQIERMNPEARFSLWRALEDADKLVEE